MLIFYQFYFMRNYGSQSSSSSACDAHELKFIIDEKYCDIFFYATVNFTVGMCKCILNVALKNSIINQMPLRCNAFQNKNMTQFLVMNEIQCG